MSLMEHSHRGKEYEAVHDEAIALLRELLAVPADYEVLFQQGGASMQFALVPANFTPPGGSADHVVTGVWSEKAFAEATAWAGVVGAKARMAASTRELSERDPGGYVRVARPDEAHLDPQAAYVHFTSNETIHGIQYLELPRFGAAPLVCDMSSDFVSRAFDVSRFALIYTRGRRRTSGQAG